MQLYIDVHENAPTANIQVLQVTFFWVFFSSVFIASFRVQSAGLGRTLPRPSQLARQELTNSPGATTAQNAVMFLDLSSETRDCQLEGGIKTRSRGLRAPRLDVTSAESMSNAPAAAPQLSSALSLRRPVLLAAPPRLLPLTGQRPGSRAGAGPSALTALVHTAACSSGDAGRLPPAPAESQEQGWCLCARPLGLTPLRAGWLAPATDWLVLSMPTSQLFNMVLSTMPFPLFSFAAMDGVPFMISEKFSCVPESVSVMHDFPSLPPPPV